MSTRRGRSPRDYDAVGDTLTAALRAVWHHLASVTGRNVMPAVGKKAISIVSPFEWRRAPQDAAATGCGPTLKAVAKPRLSALEKAARVLAHRWGNPYCRPGWP